MNALTAGRTSAEVCGDGAAVIMVHGLGGSSNTFQPQLAVLGGYRVIRPDLPGSARSVTPYGQLSIEDFARDVGTLARTLGVTRAHFVGHSLGTLVCQYIAALYPERVASMTLFGPLLEPPDVAREALRERARTARAAGMLPIADSLSQASTSARTRSENPAAIAFVRESLMRQDAEGYARTCEALADAQAAEHRRIQCPVTLVTGDEDMVTPPQMVNLLAGKLAHARVKILNRCGHWTPLEDSAGCNAALRDDLVHYHLAATA